MPQQAQVTALDALESFRSHLIVYISQARPALEEVTADVLRTRVWLESEQRTHWENELRKRKKVLEQAQQALFSARLGNLRNETAAELMAVQRAKRAVDEAEAKLHVVKRWAREYEARVQPLVKQMEKLHTLLSNDLVKGAAYLAEAINTLAAYAEIKPASFEEMISAPTPAAKATEPANPASEPSTGGADER
jgi:hypothetical protein